MNTNRTEQINRTHKSETRRAGNIIVLSAAVLVVILAFSSFSVDVGYITLAKTQMQNAADAGVFAAGMELPDGWGLGASKTTAEVAAISRQAAVDVAAANRVADRSSAYLDGARDVRFGQRSWDAGTSTWTESWGVAPYNMVEVTIRRNVALPEDGSAGNGDGPLSLFFAPIIGHRTAGLSVTATSILAQGVGFRIEAGSTQTAGVLPIAFDEQTWNDVLAGVGNDNYAYDPVTGAITAGSDGIIDFDLYPTSDTTLPPGNRGTVDIGSANNSTADLSRQILNGLNASDMAYYGGEFRLDVTPIDLNGDTGLSAGIKDELTAIIGQPRAIPIFSAVSGPGNNATYTVVKFVGVRLLEVQLTGSNKYVMVQPAPFMDSSVIKGTPKTILTEDAIFAPSMLVR
jgi:Flp pilus assembly protein TadG